MNRLLALLAVLVLAVLNAAGWWWFNRPVPVELSFNEPFPSVSFAPFRRGQGPITKVYPTADQIAEDMKSLVGVSKGVRTYTAREGLDVVPELGRRYGIEVTHSAWLGQKIAINEAEVDALIKAANAFPDVIKRVIVGNEVLLRQDLPPEQLIYYIRKVKAAVKQPVSYADVWAFWLKYPEVAREVDFLTIHILPYWEDEPIGVDGAAKHIVAIYKRMAEQFGKPILIGEAGWPTRGRSRGPAVADTANAARFVRTLALVSKENGFDYNVVEAFDQPWKAFLEGTVGAKWGVVDENRRVKYAMSGPVEPSPDWPRHAAASVLIGSALALFLMWRRYDRFDLKGGLFVLVLAQLAGLFITWQAVNALAMAYDGLEDAWAWARIGLHTVLSITLAWGAALQFRREPGPVNWAWAEKIMPLYGFAAMVVGATLLIHGRYRDIPPVEFLMPCFGIIVYALGRMVVQGRTWEEAFAVGRLFGGDGFAMARRFVTGLALSALAAPLSEAWALSRGDDFVTSHPQWSDRLPLLIRALWENQEMMVWAAMVVVMILPFWAEARLRSRP
ncbi:putative beta (1-6) glucans synthase [Paramagnetospirillum magnetotacticum MS-1]|uniref:Endo-1,3-beta-glucanase btgC n=1 Tax=Paramagnetospirillum magnetotacticum MS-1 TaxID=272627 RepID=A0A0C2YWC8_PARME|nr:exo-beta-1,3-glucanase [Paramagnetospirillum magnetotacticum]KIL99005.1 putative beta (1-6) glucans synthase [Paramagnetospirillum magnetotacticum MS-1]